MSVRTLLVKRRLSGLRRARRLGLESKRGVGNRRTSLVRPMGLASLGLATSLAMAACSGGGPSAPSSADRTRSDGSAREKPNLVLIVADDLGYGDVGCYGSRTIPTPNIDALAAAGVRFTEAYVASPVCSPSRAAFLTGRYPQRFGHEFNGGPLARDIAQRVGLPGSETTMAEILQQAGYATGLVGKWHLGVSPEYHPLRRGFQEFFGFLFGGPYIDGRTPGVTNVRTFEEKQTLVRDPRDRILRNDAPVEENGYLTDAFTREAVAFIERHQGGPFFLDLAYKTPHTPLQVTKTYLDRIPAGGDEAHRVYAAMVVAMDDGVGRVLDALRRTNLEKDTLVLFLSDNGCATYTNACSNAPLRAGKYSLFEGGIRVPFVMRWPGKVPAGLQYREAISSLDILPTFAAAGRAVLPSDRSLDGRDLLPYLVGASRDAPHDALYWRIGSNLAVRRGRWKLIKAGDRIQWLFDVSADVGESRNVADQHPDVVKDLSSQLAAWNAQMVPPRWPSNRIETVPVEGGTIELFE